MKKSIEFLSKLSINKSNYIILGCSGGPDSMCLLNILKEQNYQIICAHINHNIRPESKDEYIFVKNYCKKNNIIFEGLELKEDKTKNEAYYRKKRHNFYKNLANKYHTSYILTAHHGDDLMETILMRITRGSNLKGYAGFSKIYHEDNLTYIKPLIFYTKKEILEYNETHQIPFVIDSSNELDKYTRNRYRHNILPFLKNEYSCVHQKYLQFSEELNETDEFIDFLVKQEKKKNYHNQTIDLKKFKNIHPLLQKRELSLILKEIYLEDVDKLQLFHIEKILTMVSLNKNFTLDLPLDKKVIKEYDKLMIVSQKFHKPFKIEFNQKLIFNDGSYIEKVDSTTDNSNNTIRLNSKDIKLPLYLRTKKDGDKMAIKNLNGTKSVKSIFIDEKIPASIRNEFPILVDANDTILWLPSLRKSKFDINKSEKYDIILKYTKKGDKINEEK